MSENASTSADRAWITQASDAIAKRRKATFRRLVNEPVGMAPRLHIVGRMLTYTGKDRVRSNQLMLDVLLKHPSFEIQDGVDGDSFMTGALSAPMLDAIPLLLAKGFVMKPRNMQRALILSHLAYGRWPHPDLLAPDLLDCPQNNMGGLHMSMFSNPGAMNEEFLRKLVTLPNEGADWAQKVHDGFLGACSGGKIQAKIEKNKMHRGEVITSLAVLHARGWLTQDGLEQSVERNRCIEADWLTWARELMGDVVVHELQQSTPMTAGRVSPRRI